MTDRPKNKPPKLHSDDSDMSRFEREGLLRFRARDGVIAICVVTLALVFLAGGAIRDAGDQMDPGIGRDIVKAIGEPTGWVADQLPFAEAAQDVTAGLSPDVELGGGGFETAQSTSDERLPPVTPDYFDPQALGEAPAPTQPLETLLVTGDSLATPLDLELSRRYSEQGVEVITDPHLATGISKSDLLDWGELATSQVERYSPDAVVVFIGANEGFPIPGPGGEDVECCGAEWAAAYANRARQVMATYAQDGAAHVYWLTVPTPRDEGQQEIERVVNAGIEVAAQPLASQVDILDMVSIFTPGDSYRDAMPIDGEETIVRESDGIHLNDAGSELAADRVQDAINQDFAP